MTRNVLVEQITLLLSTHELTLRCVSLALRATSEYHRALIFHRHMSEKDPEVAAEEVNPQAATMLRPVVVDVELSVTNRMHMHMIDLLVQIIDFHHSSR